MAAILTTYCEDIKSMPGASGRPKPKFLSRKLAVEDDNMTPEDKGSGLTQEVVAAASADIVDCADEDGTAALSQRRRSPLPRSKGRGRASQQDWVEPGTN